MCSSARRDRQLSTMGMAGVYTHTQLRAPESCWMPSERGAAVKLCQKKKLCVAKKKP